MTKQTYHGSCHCRAVTYEAEMDLAKGSTRCNCSYCAKARAWFSFTPASQLRVKTGEAALSRYQWIPPGKTGAHLQYFFCSTCGVRMWARGEMDALGGQFYAVHIPTLDDAEGDLKTAPIRYVDGRHDAYGQEPADVLHV